MTRFMSNAAASSKTAAAIRRRRTGPITRPRLSMMFVLPFFVVALYAAGCTEKCETKPGPIVFNESEIPVFSITPGNATQFGHVWIEMEGLEFTLDNAAPISVRVGRNPCLLPEVAGPRGLRCFVQGAPEPGAVAVTVTQGEKEARYEQAFTYTPAKDKIFRRMYAVGGSVGAGIESASWSMEAQMNAIPALLAKMAGAYFPLPLVGVDKGENGCFPEVPELTDIDPETERLPTDFGDDALSPYLSGEYPVLPLRLDPDLAAHNLSIPFIDGIGDILDGIDADGRAHLYQSIVRDPYERKAPAPLLDDLEKLKPTFVIVTCDVLDFFAERRTDGRSLAGEEIEAELDRLFIRFGEISPPPYVFILNTPPDNVHPGRYSEYRRYETIRINNALERSVSRANRRLEGPKRFFTADFHSYVMKIIAAEKEVELFDRVWPLSYLGNGEPNMRLSRQAAPYSFIEVGFDPFEGFFSLDGRSFTATGNAFAANVLAETVNAAVGPSGERILLPQALTPLDLAEIAFKDPHSIKEIEEAFFALAESERPFPDLTAVMNRDAPLTGFMTAHHCAVKWKEYEGYDELLCPAGMELVSGGGTELYANAGEFLQISLHTYDEDDLPVVGYPVAALAEKGSINENVVFTDIEGGVIFTYIAPEEEATDRITAVCGGLTLVLTVHVGE